MAATPMTMRNTLPRAEFKIIMLLEAKRRSSLPSRADIAPAALSPGAAVSDAHGGRRAVTLEKKRESRAQTMTKGSTQQAAKPSSMVKVPLRRRHA